MPGADEYDAIILGAGHNGLVLQAYLSRAGLKTLSLDRAEVAGGGLRTREWPEHSGFLHNTHAFFLRGITEMPWYRDLELERHRARMITPELNVAMVLPEGRTLEWWTNFDKTQASFASIHGPDAERIQFWREKFRRITREILIPDAAAAPKPAEERRRRLEESAEGRLLLETSALSPLQFVRREFEHPAVQAALLFFNGLREVDLRLPGFGHHIPSLLAADRFAQICEGGSARLGEALVAAVREYGGEVRTGIRLSRILVQNGRATGVEMGSGEMIRARRLIASSLNPHQTFVDLIEPHPEGAEVRKRAEQFQYNLIAPLFGLHLNLDAAPEYTATRANEALMVIQGLERAEQFEEIVAAHEAGKIPENRVMWGSCPSRFDPSQAPAGKHVAFLWEKLPYALKGDSSNWEKEREIHASRMRERWTRDCPNLADSISGQFAQSPLEVEQHLPNLRFGDLLGGSFANGQVGAGRPFRGAGNYRTEIDGLYLCGSCCHPGGNVTGLPGYNAAHAVAEDLGMVFP